MMNKFCYIASILLNIILLDNYNCRWTEPWVLFKPSVSSWGGLPVFDPTTKLWHLFAAEMEGGCDVYSSWKNNSRVIRATSVTVTGPYTFAAEVRIPFAHNPTVRRMPDGSIVLWMIGGWKTVPRICGGSIASPYHGKKTDNNFYSNIDPGPAGDGCGPEPPYRGMVCRFFSWCTHH